MAKFKFLGLVIGALIAMVVPWWFDVALVVVVCILAAQEDAS